MSGYAALIQGGAGLAGGGVSLLGASRKKRALNKAEQAYYDAMSKNLDAEHGIGQLEQGDYRQLEQGHDANLSSLIDNFTGAQPANDGFRARLADTVGQAGAAVPVMNQSWAYQGAPATDTTARQEGITAAHTGRLADTMVAEHDLNSQQDAQQNALAGFQRGEMPLSAHAAQLAQYYGLGRASRGYDFQKKKNALGMALKKAGTTGDEQMMWGSLIGSVAGGAGAMGGGSGSSSDSGGSSGSWAGSDYPSSGGGGYYDSNGNIVPDARQV